MAFSPRIGIDVFRAEVGLMRNITHGEFLPVQACFEGVIIYSWEMCPNPPRVQRPVISPYVHESSVYQMS